VLDVFKHDRFKTGAIERAPVAEFLFNVFLLGAQILESLPFLVGFVVKSIGEISLEIDGAPYVSG